MVVAVALLGTFCLAGCEVRTEGYTHIGEISL